MIELAPAARPCRARSFLRAHAPCLLLLAAVCLAPTSARAQDAAHADRAAAEAKARAAVAGALAAWVADYEADRLGVRGVVRSDTGLQPRYVSLARTAGVLGSADFGRLNHLDALQKMLFFAENNPDEAVGDALLQLAGVGLEKSLIERDPAMLRDLGHWTLMRIEHQGVWFLLMRAAAGERLPLLTQGRDEDEPVDPARRVAALKLLGMKARPVFRSTIEGALTDADPRVRLAAVEALDFQRRPESLPVLVRMVATERHPVVSQAVVRALRVVLASAGAELPDGERDLAVRSALRQLGSCGWRTDMDLVALVEEYPVRAAVPAMISILERSGDATDPLVALVNRRASPLLRDKAYGVLRGLTGAILPAEDTTAWREFWEREKDRIQVPRVLPQFRDQGNTRSTFFGIPVTGREIAFVIDTSGSMDQAVGGTESSGGRRSARQPTRLSLAKEQLLLAVQSMEPESRYHLLTFAGDARVWSRKAVPPTVHSTRSLTELLSRLSADGGTNVYEGLVHAMQLDELRFGEQGERGVDELFLLSDGEPTTGQITDTEQLLAMVRDANKYLKVRINTVFAGSGKGAEFLRKLAEENGGVFVQR